MERLDFGLVYAVDLCPARSSERYEQYQETIDMKLSAERLGFSTALICEHHFAEDGYFSSPIVAATGLASRTSKIRIGTGILLLPLHNPISVGEDVAVADIISNGRFILGVGYGWRRY